jgi:Bifunctional DNA primase/polymerase, N-terminal
MPKHAKHTVARQRRAHPSNQPTSKEMNMAFKFGPFPRKDGNRSSRVKRDSDRRELNKQARQAARAEQDATRDVRMKMRRALTWLQCGAPIVPLAEGGKKPMLEGGVHAALTKRAEVIALFARWPRANYGIVTGRVSGLIVIDVDGPEGAASLCALEKQYGPLPVTVVVGTPRGRYIIFQHKGKRIPNSAQGNRAKEWVTKPCGSESVETLLI